MKTKHAISTCLVIVCGLAAALHAQTPPLTPSGPPSDPTTAMKSLNQVEPRTPIGSLPFTITQPGSYYFTKNLEFAAATGHAISVNSNNVSIDMMGFTLSSTAPVTGYGIFIGGDNIAVTNGMIKGTTVIDTNTWTVTPGGFERGVACEEAGHHGRNLQLSRLFVSACRGTGIRGFFSTSIDDCNIGFNGSNGVDVLSTAFIRRCIVMQNAGTGIQCWAEINVTDCVVGGNGGTGIYAPISTVSNCCANNNGGVGIFVTSGVVSFCQARGNASPQISSGASTMTGNFTGP